MASTEERLGRLEGTYPHLATKEDIAEVRGDLRELRGEFRALRWLMGSIGVGLTALALILKYLG